MSPWDFARAWSSSGSTKTGILGFEAQELLVGALQEELELQTWMFEELGEAIGGFHDEQPKPRSR